MFLRIWVNSDHPELHIKIPSFKALNCKDQSALKIHSSLGTLATRNKKNRRRTKMYKYYQNHEKSSLQLQVQSCSKVGALWFLCGQQISETW